MRWVKVVSALEYYIKTIQVYNINDCNKCIDIKKKTVHIFLCEPFLLHIIHYFAGTTAPLYFSLMKSRMSLDCNTSTKALIFHHLYDLYELQLGLHKGYY